MRGCKNFFHLLSFFVIAVPCLVSGITFKDVDFERLLEHHPVMKDYDPSTGRFKNTAGEVIPVEVLKQRIASITKDIRRLEEQRTDLVGKAMEVGSDKGEADIWGQLGSIDRAVKELDLKLRAETSLLEDQGVPGFDKAIGVVTRIFKETIASAAVSDGIVLNKLPRFMASPPQMAEHDLRRFFLTLDEACLRSYLAQAGLVGLMFSETDKPVIYYRKGAETGADQ